MLKSLNVKNYAIIDNLSIDFDRGFNVFIGETGAGKSIIVGALSFLLKGRSDSSIIKTGKDKAIIEGVFDVKDQSIVERLKEQDIDIENDIIVKRVISKDNHNSIKINESNVTLNFLTELFANYVDIHSQKDNHFLFNKKNQLSLLDRYAKNEDLLKQYNDLYNNYLTIKKDYDNLLNNTYNEKEIDFYKFDLNELNDANLSLEEEADLQAKEKRYKESENYIKSLSEAISLYDQNYGIKENLYNLTNALNVDDQEIQNITSEIQDIYYSLDDKVNRLKTILSGFGDDDINIESIEERLYLYSKLKRKHKTDVEGLLVIQNELNNKILSFEDRDHVINEKKKELSNAFNKAKEVANLIHINRVVAANALSLEVEKEAIDLLLNNIKFDIEFKEIELNSNGLDEVEFMVSLNKGEDLKPLRNVASGGEISRLLLALKVVFSKLSKTELLILDEIDSGVSGKVALSIGQKIAKISKDVQVLCISHLAPVAACANSHYLIYKEDNDTSTFTNVKKLEENDLIKQLAIISNTSTDDSAINAAKDLYISCQNKINEGY